MKNIKVIGLFALGTILCQLSSCSLLFKKIEEPDDPNTVIIPIRGLDDDEKIVNLYNLPVLFINGNKAVPYVSMKNFKKLFNVFLSQAQDGLGDFYYKFDKDGSKYKITHKYNKSYLQIDFDTGEFSYSDRYKFLNVYDYPDSRQNPNPDYDSEYHDPLNIVNSTIVGANNESYSVKTLSHTYSNSSDILPLHGNFKEYGIDSACINGQYYIPFKIALDIIKDSYETNYVYNGTYIYQFSSVLIDKRTDNIVNDFTNSWKFENDDADLLDFSYKELCFQLSLSYGLKQGSSRFTNRNISNILELCNSKSYKDDWTKSAFDFNVSTCKLFGQELGDGGHSAVIGMFIDYLTDKGNPDSKIKRSDYYTPEINYDEGFFSSLTSARNATNISHNDTSIDGSVIDKKYQYFDANGDEVSVNSAVTMFYTFDEFSNQQITDSKEILNIVKQHTNIKNVVFDISCNGGGLVSTIPALSTLLNGHCKIAVKDAGTNATSVVDCKCDINGDKNYNNDSINSYASTYILTSQCSFSCGNLLPYLNGYDAYGNSTKIIGKKSSGGCCIVGYGTNGLGTTFAVSSNMMLGVMEGNEFKDVDNGATIDNEITDFNSNSNLCDDFFNRKEIIKNLLK